jgi:hypothetical protein
MADGDDKTRGTAQVLGGVLSGVGRAMRAPFLALWAVVGLPSGVKMSTIEIAIRLLARLGGALTLAIIAIGIAWSAFPETRPAVIDLEPGAGVALIRPLAFVAWALLAASASFLTGGLFGLLFGLPAVSRRSGADDGTGYVESTSLEQVADFLVKGLVALTLTQFDDWAGRYEILSRNVTSTLLGVRTSDAVPGGVLVGSYALLGFLLAYLWMRRWFIGELVLAQNEQRVLLNSRVYAEVRDVAAAKADDRQGVGSSAANNPKSLASTAREMAEQAATHVQSTARAEAKELAEAVKEAPPSDDPWKGAFGGQAARDGYVLSANVSPLISDPSNFQVDLQLAVEDRLVSDRIGMVAHFFLHPTFGSRPRDVTIGRDGRATLQLFSYGAFTVGVLTEDGVKLELDLSQIAGVPPRFLER